MDFVVEPRGVEMRLSGTVLQCCRLPLVAGVSVWRLILPTLICAALLGALAFAVHAPIAAGTLKRFETLKARSCHSGMWSATKCGLMSPKRSKSCCIARVQRTVSSL